MPLSNRDAPTARGHCARTCTRVAVLVTLLHPALVHAAPADATGGADRDARDPLHRRSQWHNASTINNGHNSRRSDPLPGFGPPHLGLRVQGATVQTLNGTSLTACGAACTDDKDCIALTWDGSGGGDGTCTLSGWSPLYEVVADEASSYFSKTPARNDSGVPPSGVVIRVAVPTGGVRLGPGCVHAVYRCCAVMLIACLC